MPTKKSAAKKPVKKKRPVKRRNHLDPTPKILIFDVDGVLVDVRETFWLSALQTVRELTGKRATMAELHKWKSKPGNNDDWNMIANWVTALGHPISYEEARAAFQKFYWGTDGEPGNVVKEKLLLTGKQLEKWAGRFEINLFTGRTRKEYAYTFDKWPHSKYFRMVVTMDDVTRKKPAPDGVLKILGNRDPKSALYLGDNIDDALSAKAAGVRFMGILGPKDPDYRARAVRFRKLDALALLPRITDLNKWL